MTARDKAIETLKKQLSTLWKMSNNIRGMNKLAFIESQKVTKQMYEIAVLLEKYQKGELKKPYRPKPLYIPAVTHMGKHSDGYNLLDRLEIAQQPDGITIKAITIKDLQ